MKRAAHLSPPPAGAGKLIAWHNKLDVAAYQATDGQDEWLVIDGRAYRYYAAVQTIVFWSGMSVGRARRLIIQWEAHAGEGERVAP